MKLLDNKNKIYLLDEESFDFPSLDMMKDNLVAVGGDFHPQRLLNAYENGIFPWYIDEYNYIHWFSPKKRMILKPDKMKVSKSLRKSIQNKGFIIKSNEKFEEVIKSCANIKRKHEDSTWISEEFIQAYTTLHKLEIAFSIECYFDDELVGGLYGLLINDVFCGESMFAKVSNASKAGFIQFVAKYHKKYELIDCQVFTEHLASLGAVEISSDVFLEYLEQ